jgi:hypothetical protein
MSALSDHLENALLNHTLRNTPYSRPATLYFALFTADPGDSGVTGEVSGGSYARAAVSNDNVSFPQCAATGTPTKTNATTISFPTATAPWGTVTHWAIYDAASGSTNMIARGALSATRSIVTGDAPRIAVGAVSLAMTNAASGGITDFAKRKLLDHVFGGPSYTPVSTIYTGLGTALDGESLTEWSDSSYTRQATAFDAASGGACVNSDAETYSSSVASGAATLSHFGIWDDSGAGNLLAAGPLGTSRAVVDTDTVTLPDSALSITLQ